IRLQDAGSGQDTQLRLNHTDAAYEVVVPLHLLLLSRGIRFHQRFQIANLGVKEGEAELPSGVPGGDAVSEVWHSWWRAGESCVHALDLRLTPPSATGNPHQPEHQAQKAFESVKGKTKERSSGLVSACIHAGARRVCTHDISNEGERRTEKPMQIQNEKPRMMKSIKVLNLVRRLWHPPPLLLPPSLCTRPLSGSGGSFATFKKLVNVTSLPSLINESTVGSARIFVQLRTPKVG
ncbi:hypothetical protein B0H13DRAFT_1913288, partial [Mycena leptocephala]